ncbi:DUF4192 family protein [Corynebacterium diphtheriae]|uniref:DUF4192 family protein n=1 Tax=Corynebacterium diphtheriae TaxID=1717 RepID=UPI0013CA9800|nr:DUF4192 family protein [Corynebacterium diphtheriae]MBG9292522.1 DUF4192 family protein [Corynebacterium diphtheriae bv. gravis]MBG9373296.1 DUF4192 family protein [Corynebacterium diphtheriae bv. gravis]CAB0686563.1 hypothetical protein FRC0022_00758 [Corynebacterium diphtheriae]CAB0898633.1 hypothetical protein FRC0429_00806 [Corynebacterium diphtheriae]
MSATTTFPPAARLIAEIPAILGFHPSNSAIFLLLRRLDTNTLNLGPVLRMDAGDTASLPQITECINSFDVDVVFTVISSEKTHHTFISDIVQAGIDNLDIVWHVRGISEDEPYTALWTAEPAHTYSTSMLAGLVSPIHSALSTRDLLSKGDVIACDRNEALDALAFDCRRSEAGEAGEALLQRATAMLDEVGPISDLILPLRDDLAHGRHDDAQARIVAALLASADARDLALGELLGCPKQGEELLIGLAQQLPLLHLRAGALAMLACLLLNGGHRARAGLAIKAAGETCADHRLTQLLTEAQMVGALDVLVPALNEGISIARTQANIPEPV